MAAKDVAQCAELERDAFPTLFPPTSFRRELNNRMAAYLVACREITDPPQAWEAPAENEPEERTGPGLLMRALLGARSALPGRHLTHDSVANLIVGLVGTWFMVDEAHIVSVAVRTMYRRQGVGELLLISAIKQAMNRRARVVTLEVRASNQVAQNLYAKYGFRKRGVRKAYYSDNREDAYIMTTPPIQLRPFPDRFGELVAEYNQNWAHAVWLPTWLSAS